MTDIGSEPLRLIQRGLEQLGHSPGAVDGLWGLRTARALKALLAANSHAAAVAPPGPLPWITEAKSALGRNEARDRFWLMDWLKRDGRSLGDPAKNPWCGDFVETCIRMALPDEPLLGALGTNPYWARNWLLFGQETKPVTGAVLIFERGSGGHVGFAMGQDDKHLDVQVSLHKYAPAGQAPMVVVSSVVHIHNALGHAYMAVVKPFHRRIVRAMLGRLQ